MTHTIRTLAAVAAFLAVSLLVAPSAQALRGDAADWTWGGVAAADTSAFDPCTTITWSADGLPITRGMVRATRQVTKWSGLTFSQVPTGGMIHASWTEGLGSLGLTTLSWGFRGEEVGNPQRWTTSVAIEFLPSLFDPRHPRRFYTAVMHEMGHAVGLGHASDTVEVMGGNSSAHRYQSGDRAGLRAVQRTACAPVLMASGPVSRTTVG